MGSLPDPASPPSPAPPPNGRFLEVDGIETFYIQEGSGAPLLLIHGASPGACTQVNWKHNLGTLAQAGFAVFAYDQPGFGHSEIPPDFSLEYRIAHGRAFATACGLDRFSVVGNSMGAYIAAKMALEDPRVVKLVLVASSVLAPPGSAEAAARAAAHSEELRAFEPTRDRIRTMTARTLVNKTLVTEALIEERLAMSSGSRYAAFLQRRRASRPAPLGNRLRDLKVKTLIIWGAQDRGAAVERALLLCQEIPGAELHIFEESGHWVQWDQAERFNRVVADFLGD